MTTIRIVCTLDAAATAETLMRLLVAEQHDVCISKGRQSLLDLPAARGAKEAVVLIWSKDARYAQFILDWADATEPARLIELARAAAAPRRTRKAAPIEFSTWRGERGGKAWAALKERLRQVASAWEPAKPPPLRTVAAAGVAGACALAGVLAIGVNAQNAEPTPEPAFDAMAFESLAQEPGGMGGVAYAVEPPSVEDLSMMPMPARLRTAAYTPLAAYEPPDLGDVPDMRDPTLLERLIALNPLDGE